MPDILSQADNIETISEASPHLTEMLNDMGLPQTMELYNLMEYLDITKDNYFDEATRKKVSALYEWGVKQGNPLSAIQGLNARMGVRWDVPAIDKLYSYVKLDKEIGQTVTNLQGLIKQKNSYEDSDSISKQ